MPIANQEDALQNLLTYLEKEYYTPIEASCEKVEEYITELHEGDVHQEASLYTSLSKKLTGQVAQYIKMRRFGLLPYITELLEKEDNGHDCRSCSSSCSIRHGSQLVAVRESHQKIKETLYRVLSVATPTTYSDTRHDTAHRHLREAMRHLNTMLAGVFFLEESLLIPKIQEAQKAIHAHD